MFLFAKCGGVRNCDYTNISTEPQIPSPDYPFPGYPAEFSPTATSRARRPQPQLTPPTKYVRVKDPIPNRYIVVLNEDVVDRRKSVSDRRSDIAAIANEHARGRSGTLGFVYASALTGYSMELPNEAAAIAISHNPKVKWVEQVAMAHIQQAEGGDLYYPESLQFNPPWGLDAIDGSIPVPPVQPNGTTTGQYIYNASGYGVVVFVVDSGLRKTHQELVNRSTNWGDCIAYANCSYGQPSPYLDACISPKPNANDNDCLGHGTHVAATAAGNTYGVAKGAYVYAIKVCLNTTIYGLNCPVDAVNAGVDYVTNFHVVAPEYPVVANMSLALDSRYFGYAFDNAVQNSINAGVPFVASAGNSADDVRYFSPAHLPNVIAVGATNSANSVATSFSNIGNGIDVFAPGEYVVSAFPNSDTGSTILNGTSMAAPHVTGASALYLEGRPGNVYCPSIDGPAYFLSSTVSTCPDRVQRFIDANANLNRLSNTNGYVHDPNGNYVFTTSPNRFLLTSGIPTWPNPIDNNRFFVWQHYADFLPGQPSPDESGLDWWTNEIIGHGHCSTGVNGNNACTDLWRTLTSRAFWVAGHGDLFTNDYGLRPGKNGEFVELCYQLYLRRHSDPAGYNFWLNSLTNNYGDPANAGGVINMITAFLHSAYPDGYRARFGG